MLALMPVLTVLGSVLLFLVAAIAFTVELRDRHIALEGVVRVMPLQRPSYLVHDAGPEWALWTAFEKHGSNAQCFALYAQQQRLKQLPILSKPALVAAAIAILLAVLGL